MLLSKKEVYQQINKFNKPTISDRHFRASTVATCLPKQELFDLIEKIHSEDGKHLGGERLFFQLKKKCTGFSRILVLAFVVNSKNLRYLSRSIVVRPTKNSEFSSRGQVDLMNIHVSVSEFHHIISCWFVRIT